MYFDCSVNCSCCDADCKNGRMSFQYVQPYNTSKTTVPLYCLVPLPVNNRLKGRCFFSCFLSWIYYTNNHVILIYVYESLSISSWLFDWNTVFSLNVVSLERHTIRPTFLQIFKPLRNNNIYRDPHTGRLFQRFHRWIPRSHRMASHFMASHGIPRIHRGSQISFLWSIFASLEEGNHYWRLNPENIGRRARYS